MRHRAGLALGMLLLVGARDPLAAQQGRKSRSVLDIQTPRPAPVLPVALIPFRIDEELCRGGRQPFVTFQVFNSLGRPEATLYLRTRRFEVLDSLPMRCGEYVAVWDGTINKGQRLANPAVYYLRLLVGNERETEKLVVSGP